MSVSLITKPFLRSIVGLAYASDINEWAPEAQSAFRRITPFARKAPDFPSTAKTDALALKAHRLFTALSSANQIPKRRDVETLFRFVEELVDAAYEATEAAPRHETSEENQSPDRIFLVGPARELSSLLNHPQIHRDDDIRKWTGNAYVIPGAIPECALPFLPMAYRRTKPAFDFSGVHINAGGQNLWSLFDQASWRAITTEMKRRHGGRCQLCGATGGNLIDVVEPPDTRKTEWTVECHELWSWHVVNNDYGIGIQKLEAFYLLCVDCHNMWHQRYAMTRAGRLGRDPMRVQKYLDLRRRLYTSFTAIDQHTLEQKQKQEAMRTQYVRTWVMDLSFLMKERILKHPPTLTKPEYDRLISGIRYNDTDGRDIEPTPSTEVAQRHFLREGIQSVRSTDKDGSI